MKRLTFLPILAVIAAVVILAHTEHTTASGATTVHVILKDYHIFVAQRNLPVGKLITFAIANRGHHVHEFVLEPANAVDKAIKFHGLTYEADTIKPGTTRTVTWTIPHAGTFKLACHIDHHYQMGMSTLVTAGRPR